MNFSFDYSEDVTLKIQQCPSVLPLCPRLPFPNVALEPTMQINGGRHTVNTFARAKNSF